MNVSQKIAEELNLKLWQVENTVNLIDLGNTVPFIARYRKEVTGSLDDQVLRSDVRRFKALRPGKQFVDLGFGGFGIFFFCLHLGLGVFHRPLSRFQFDTVLDQHGINNAQIKLAITCQCLDCFFLQGGHLLLRILKIFLRLLVRDLVRFLISGTGQFQQALPWHGLDL